MVEAFGLEPEHRRSSNRRKLDVNDERLQIDLARNVRRGTPYSYGGYVEASGYVSFIMLRSYSTCCAHTQLDYRCSKDGAPRCMYVS